MAGTSTIPPDYQDANPLLYTFRDDNTGIQPYFIAVSQFFFFEFSFRLWDRAVYGTWLLPSDFIDVKIIKSPPPPPPLPPPAIFAPRRRRASRIRTIYLLNYPKAILLKTSEQLEKNRKKPTFDLFDILFACSPLFAHAIWYCVIQSNCMSGAFATTWNCYNLFGYRIYNYLFDPYSMFAYEYISKMIILRDKRHHEVPWIVRKKKWRRVLGNIIFYPSMIISTITFVFVSAMLLPYIFTNVIPMVVIYSFIVTIYAYIVTIYAGLLKFYTFVTKKIFKIDNDKLPQIEVIVRKYHFKRRFIVYFAIRWSPHLVPFLFNLSQYFFYSADFLGALNREASSRSIVAYFERVRNSPQIVHTILTAI
ncbi:unnamed protein product [Adineta ricciae]|uniref:Uncharacterized protein n=1 Tax=Adineta ricciae TaxID=249248 RepID=A0A815GT58_ADIRI|nr:unnamed protein product [Adineta ricciae]CAF1599290.1 unnamed protein product [Adineta ricciae]